MVRMKCSSSSMIGFGAALGAAGFVIGGLVGFVARPSVPMLGQLPFEYVIARGANLNGLDRMLAPLAQRSFDIMLMGAVLGAGVAVLGAVTLRAGLRVREATANDSEIKRCPSCAELVRLQAAKCRFCGYEFGLVGVHAQASARNDELQALAATGDTQDAERQGPGPHPSSDGGPPVPTQLSDKEIVEVLGLTYQLVLAGTGRARCKGKGCWQTSEVVGLWYCRELGDFIHRGCLDSWALKVKGFR